MMNSKRFSLSAAAFAGAMVLSSAAWAHIDIVSPSSRYGPEEIKDAPCGHPDNPPGVDPPHVYEVGETITVVIDEFIGHNGHMRIAFAESDQDIVTVTAFDDFDNFPGVLVDDIDDPPGGGMHMVDVTLPSEPCEGCVLQVIQVMYDGDGFQENDLYYSCADITLVPVGAGTGGSDSGGEMDTGGDDIGDTGGDETGGDTGAGSTDEGGAEDPDDGADDAVDDGADAGDDDDDDDDDVAAEDSGGSDGAADGGDDSSGGCSCRADADSTPGWALLGLIALGLRRRRN